MQQNYCITPNMSSLYLALSSPRGRHSPGFAPRSPSHGSPLRAQRSPRKRRFRGGSVQEVRALVQKKINAVIARIERRQAAAANAERISANLKQPRTLLSMLEFLWLLHSDDLNHGKPNSPSKKKGAILLPNGRKLRGQFKGSWEELDHHLQILAEYLTKILPPGKKPQMTWSLKVASLKAEEVLNQGGLSADRAPKTWKPIRKPKKQLLWVNEVQNSVANAIANLALGTPEDYEIDLKALDARAELTFKLLDHSDQIQSLNPFTWELAHPEEEARRAERRIRVERADGSLILNGQELDRLRQEWFTMISQTSERKPFKQLREIPDVERRHLHVESGIVQMIPGQHFAHINFSKDLGSLPWIDYLQADADLEVGLEDFQSTGFVIRIYNELSEPILVRWRALHEDWRFARKASPNGTESLSQHGMLVRGIIVDYPLKPEYVSVSGTDDKPLKSDVAGLIKGADLEEMRPFDPPVFPSNRVQVVARGYHAGIIIDCNPRMLQNEYWHHVLFTLRKFLKVHGKRVFGHGGKLTLACKSSVFTVSNISSPQQLENAQRWVARLSTLPDDDDVRLGDAVLGIVETHQILPLDALHIFSNSPFQAAKLTANLAVPVHPIEMIGGTNGERELVLNLDDAETFPENLEEVTQKWQAQVDAYTQAYCIEEEEIRQRNRAKLAAANAKLTEKSQQRQVWAKEAHRAREEELKCRAIWRWNNLAILYQKYQSLTALNQFMAVASVKAILKHREAQSVATGILSEVFERSMVQVAKSSWASSPAPEDVGYLQMQESAHVKNAAMKELLVDHFKLRSSQGLTVPSDLARLTSDFLPLRSASLRSGSWSSDKQKMHKAQERELKLIDETHSFLLRLAREEAIRREQKRRERFFTRIRTYYHVLQNDIPALVKDYGASNIEVRGWKLYSEKSVLGLPDFHHKKCVLNAQLELLQQLDSLQMELSSSDERESLPDIELPACFEEGLNVIPADEVNQELLRILRARAGHGACSNIRRNLGCFSQRTCIFAQDARTWAKAKVHGDLASLHLVAENAARKKATKEDPHVRASLQDAYHIWREDFKREIVQMFEREAVEPVKAFNARVRQLDSFAMAAAHELQLVQAFAWEMKRSRRRMETANEGSERPKLATLRRAIECAFLSIHR